VADFLFCTEFCGPPTARGGVAGPSFVGPEGGGGVELRDERGFCRTFGEEIETSVD
jgi:hypothetical protein